MRSVVIIITCALWVFVDGREAAACSCLPPRPAAESLAEAALVFHGVVVAKSEEGFQLEIFFEPRTIWKGPLDPALVVKTAINTAACGYPFVEGNEYIVYASAFEGDFFTGLCSRTRPFQQEEADALGAPIWTSDGPSLKRGDLTQDGRFDVGDVIAALRFLFARGPAPDCLKSVDANDNGRLSIDDALTMLLSLFDDRRPALPTPFEDCGPDPTPDSLPCRSYSACE